MTRRGCGHGRLCIVTVPSSSFFFYDLETSGLSPREARIMQFAGRRTDMNLQPVGDPENVLIKLSDDILPDPDAVLITAITPQATIADGVSEAEFLKHFAEHISLPGTIFVGYNTVRFDDEFIRYLHYRNFYDPYEWQWQEGRSKWDMLDVVRMTRALRPEGIKWPVDTKGKATNRLELLTAMNGLSHEHAHDALSDVDATIAVAQLIRTKQQKLFDFLLTMRDKRKVAELVTAEEPFVYTSGSYPSEFEKTTVAYAICPQPRNQGSFVYDLRQDPSQYRELMPDQLADLWRWKKDAAEPRLPVKMLQYNHCPAVAPLGVLDKDSQKRLQIDMATIQKHLTILKSMDKFEDRLCKAWEILESSRSQGSLLSTEYDVDGALYDGFFDDGDKRSLAAVRSADPKELGALDASFTDKRLNALLPLYKARNYPKLLNPEEREGWEKFRTQRLVGGGKQSRIAKFLGRLQELSGRSGLTKNQTYLLEELRLYAESIMPEPAE